MSTIIQDNEGNSSSMRLMCLAWALVPLAVWAIIAITTRSLPNVPDSILYVLAIVLTGKTVSKGVELAAPVSTTTKE